MRGDVVTEPAGPGVDAGPTEVGADPAGPAGALPGERGFVLVWFAVAIVLLLSVAALAVDLGHAYFVAQKAQNAADAAALAGAPLLPGDQASAFSTARNVAQDNGFSGAGVVPERQSQPTQLKVTVTERVATWFGGVMGFPTINVRRSAVADYDQPVAMGSPSNTFGDQPKDCTTSSSAPCSTPPEGSPQFWFNVAGPDSPKQNGDAIQAEGCGDGVDGCSGGTNTDYDPHGYYYVVRDDAGAVPLRAFDPGFVNVGDNCTSSDHGSNLSGLYSSLNANPAFQADAGRYAPGSDTQWCTGDQIFDGHPTTPVTTHYRILAPDETPWDNTDNANITAQCAAGSPVISSLYQPDADGGSIVFPGWSGDLAARWNAELGNPGLPPLVTRYFRKWVTLCNLPAPSGASHDYLLQIYTNDGSGLGSGHNRGALAAGPPGAQVSIFGSSKMSLYANASGADTRFYLARVLPGAQNRTLVLRFFDTGDASQAGTLTVLPPTDATVPTGGGGTTPLNQFSGCTYTPPPNGSMTGTNPDCSVDGVYRDTWNGQWVEWDVPIPNGYSCDYTNPGGCWVKLRFSYPPGTRVADTTTWTASLSGNPVRIVK